MMISSIRVVDYFSSFSHIMQSTGIYLLTKSGQNKFDTLDVMYDCKRIAKV